MIEIISDSNPQPDDYRLFVCLIVYLGAVMQALCPLDLFPPRGTSTKMKLYPIDI